MRGRFKLVEFWLQLVTWHQCVVRNAAARQGLNVQGVLAALAEEKRLGERALAVWGSRGTGQGVVLGAHVREVAPALRGMCQDEWGATWAVACGPLGTCVHHGPSNDVQGTVGRVSHRAMRLRTENFATDGESAHAVLERTCSPKARQRRHLEAAAQNARLSAACCASNELRTGVVARERTVAQEDSVRLLKVP